MSNPSEQIEVRAALARIVELARPILMLPETSVQTTIQFAEDMHLIMTKLEEGEEALKP